LIEFVLMQAKIIFAYTRWAMQLRRVISNLV